MRVIKIKKLDSAYWTAWQEVKKNEVELLKNDFIKKRETEFKLLYKNFTEKLSSNWSKISTKLKKPSDVIKLESTVLEKSAINEFLEEIVGEIKTHNLKVNNKEKTKKEIVDAFWDIMRWDYDQTIESFVAQFKVHTQEKDKIDNEISEIKEQIGAKREEMKSAQKETVNIDEAVGNINNELSFLATTGFKIEKHGDNSYRIERDVEGDVQFETLSEGEKTIISFLYFVELCKGKESEDETVTEKIIVIDDPISSLSHIYIFNIGQLIKNTFLTTNYKQVFVLTHSLYFFHELCYIKDGKIKKNLNLFRIIKANQGESKIKHLKENEILNEYQSYWQVLRDHNNGDSSDPLLANTMRNILEHFFGFIDKAKLGESIKIIEKESEYQFFLRYIQRESHSDLTNITDMKEIDIDIFKKAFKSIFVSSDYEDHYNKMMAPLSSHTEAPQPLARTE
jgi:wobble nucleotide-excising tRNase